MKLSAPTNRQVYLILAFFLQSSALLMMNFDTEPNGFGVLTLWIGAIVLMIGLILPVFAFSRIGLVSQWGIWLKRDLLQTAGLLLTFLVSFCVYLITLEPTASLWDCAETIAAAYKLQVPHTPGTPLTLLMARLFSMLALGDVTKVAWYINMMSAFFSAGTVGFTFLLTRYFGSAFISDKWVLFSGSMGGALCLAFSDSFWYSAVEAETYGASVFCMMLLIWLAREGQKKEETDRKNRMKLLAYLTGLAYCVHPMCILVLPVCFLIWKDRGQKFAWKNAGVCFLLGVGCILFISKVVAVDVFEWVFKLDLLVVNQLNFPFYSGVVIFILLVGLLLFVAWRKYEVSRVGITIGLLVIAGFSPYLMLFVRASKQPPINEFSPGNLAKIKPYMNRESYPNRPLLYGGYFDAQIIKVFPKAKSYVVNEGHYEEAGELLEYAFDSDRMTILPRIYSNEARHIKTYRQWTGLMVGEEACFSHNLEFMFRYQLGHMYGRYLMWNFAGRAGEVQHAAWKKPWDGLDDRTSTTYSRANNQYFMLPFLLGLLGMTVQARKDKSAFVTHLSFFLITGLLLAVYLNGTPNEPRERDYIYVGSYIAFSCWVGMGIMSLGLIARKRLFNYLSFAVALTVPGWMFYQNFDDHDRSGRTFQVDNARNILESCEPGAVLFTGGDNDTFPLWYLQEVEGFRTDVRVMVMSYFNADWYINQLTRPYYDSPPLNLTLQQNNKQYGPFEPLYVQEVSGAALDWGSYMDALNAKNPKLLMESVSGNSFFYLPSRRIHLSTNAGAIDFTVKGNYLPKNELAILDILHTNGWERPIYFNFTSRSGLNIQIDKYLSREGLLYKWVPNSSESKAGAINLEKAYQNLVQRADYSNLANSGVFFNQEDYESRMIVPLKFSFNELISGLIGDENTVRAIEVAQFAYEKLYFEHLKPSYADIQFGSLLQVLNMGELSERIVKHTFLYQHDLIQEQIFNSAPVSSRDLLILQEAIQLVRDTDLLEKYEHLIGLLSEN